MVRYVILMKTQMHFNEFLNIREKCLSDTLCETDGVKVNIIQTEIKTKYWKKDVIIIYKEIV